MFPATGAAPFTAVAGRANTAPTALSGATLASALPGKLDDLPLARISAVVEGGGNTAAASFAARLGGRSGLLWAVLLAGVLVLAGVAFALLRQLKTTPADGVEK